MKHHDRTTPNEVHIFVSRCNTHRFWRVHLREIDSLTATALIYLVVEWWIFDLHSPQFRLLLHTTRLVWQVSVLLLGSRHRRMFASLLLMRAKKCTQSMHNSILNASLRNDTYGYGFGCASSLARYRGSYSSRSHQNYKIVLHGWAITLAFFSSACKFITSAWFLILQKPLWNLFHLTFCRCRRRHRWRPGHHHRFERFFSYYISTFRFALFSARSPLRALSSQ